MPSRHPQVISRDVEFFGEPSISLCVQATHERHVVGYTTRLDELPVIRAA